MNKKNEHQPTVELTVSDINALPPLPRPTVHQEDEPPPADTPSAPRKSLLQSAPAELSVGTVIDDRYEVLERLGVGAMGSVFLVKHLRLGKSFALKIVNPDLAEQTEFVARFKREADACSRLDHPNCIVVTDFGQTDDGSLYLVMEYVAGTSLADLTAREPISLKDAFEYTRQILAGLDHAHSKGLIHRDIKLENIIRCSRENEDIHIKILDFGMAKSPVREPENLKITKRGVALGTPQYMAPEQLRNQPVDERSDLYAVGVTMFRLISGTIVFEGETMMDVFAAKLTKPAPTLREMTGQAYPEELESFLQKALSRKPVDRFHSAADMLQALETVTQQLFGTPEVASDSPPPSPPSQSLLGALFDHPIEDLVYWYTCGRNPKSARWSRRIQSLVTERTGRLVLARFFILLAFFTGAGFAIATVVLHKQPAHLLNQIAQAVHLQSTADAPSTATRHTSENLPSHNASKPASLNTAPASQMPSTEPQPAAPVAADAAAAVDDSNIDSDAEARSLLEAKMLIEKKLCRKAESMLSSFIIETSRNSGEGYYLLGRSQACQHKSGTALESYQHAIEVDPRYRTDAVIADDLKKFIQSTKTRDKAFEFIESQLGKDALPLLVQMAGHEQNKHIRHQARELVESLGALSHVNMEASLDWDLNQAGSCKEKKAIVEQLAALGSPRARQVLLRAKDAQMREGLFRKRYQHECVRKEILAALSEMKPEEK